MHPHFNVFHFCANIFHLFFKVFWSSSEWMLFWTSYPLDLSSWYEWIPAPDHFLPLLPDQPGVHHRWRYRHYWQTTALIRLRFLLIDYQPHHRFLLPSLLSALLSTVFTRATNFLPFPAVRPLLPLVGSEMKTSCDWSKSRDKKQIAIVLATHDRWQWKGEEGLIDKNLGELIALFGAPSY